MKRILSAIITISMLFAMVATPAYAEQPHVSEQVMHNIAQRYAEGELLEDANILWLLPDMMAYEELFPDSDNTVSEEVKRACIEKIIDDVKESAAPAVLAKSIIALRSMGYDARHIVTEDMGEIDIVSRLTELVDSNDPSATIIWTLPYVLIALQQGESYATAEQMELLVNLLVEKKAEWQDMMWGPDTATPVIFALAPYYATNDSVKSAVDETLLMITQQQDDTGIIGNAASTGLVIAALSGIGVDSQEIMVNGISLVDGLMTQVSENLDGFEPMSNSFSTEQGFRGLLGWYFLEKEIAKRVYDFEKNPMQTLYEVPKNTCTVIFETIPADADVVIENIESADVGVYELSEGDYKYTITKAGYQTKQGNVTITADDIAIGEKSISVTLEAYSSGGGVSTNEIKITVNVMIHGDGCENGYTYKNNSSEYNALISTSVNIDKGKTVYDALAKALKKENIEFEEENGYISKIDKYGEFDHGNYSGWMFMVNGEHKNTGCRETKLTKNSEVLWYYTDDYTKERGAQEEKDDYYKGDVSDSKDSTQIEFGLYGKHDDITYKEVVNKGKTFADIANCAGKKEIEVLAERGIINGKNKESYDPGSAMTRAEFATVVVRALGLPQKLEMDFEDVNAEDWYASYVKTAYYYGIVKGVSQNRFNPNGTITMEEAATMVERAAKLCGIKTEIDSLKAKDILGMFEDFDIVSAWATPSVAFCVEEEILDVDANSIKPRENITREYIAVMIYRMMMKAKLI